MIVSLLIILKMIKVLEKVVWEIKTYILCSIIPPPSLENLDVCELKWKNMVEPNTPHMTTKYFTRALYAG
jgi:hypothetical protein